MNTPSETQALASVAQHIAAQPVPSDAALAAFQSRVRAEAEALAAVLADNGESR